MDSRFQRFWDTMELCDWNNEGDDDKVLKPVIEYLSGQGDSAIFEFDDLMSELLYNLDTRELAEQCKKSQPSMSDDSFLYSRCVALINGPDYYEEVKQGKEKSPWNMEFEALLYVSQWAWALKHKVSVDDYPHCAPFCYETGSNEEGWKNKKKEKIDMNRNQMTAAMESLTEWLSHPAELGKAPAKIECAGEFDLYDLHYYIFKYKKSLIGKWLLGVCGGYEGDELEHCGHVFSEMENYDPVNAQEKAIALVEMMRSYWMEQAQRAEEQKENAGTFVNYVLLKEAKWDKEALLRDLKETWGIEDEPDGSGDGIDGEEDEAENTDDTLLISYQGAMITVSLMPVPIPNGEAEAAASKNFMWQKGAEQVKGHTAHLLIAVMGKELPPTESGELLVKTVVSACKQDGVLGIYSGEVVYAPDYYLHFSGMLEDDLFPIYNLVWIGLYNGKNGLCAYTGGMRYFGYDEIEVLDSQADAEILHGFLSDIANCVITTDQKLPIKKSKGVAVEGDSLKIEF